jgi:hypothetical protein
VLQKPARGILEAYNAVSQLIGFVLMSVFFGMFGYLLWQLVHEKIEKVELISFICLAVSLSIFYGGYIVVVLVRRRRGTNRGRSYFLLWLSLVCWTVAVAVGYFIAGHPE